jgi:hypothetical protein
MSPLFFKIAFNVVASGTMGFVLWVGLIKQVQLYRYLRAKRPEVLSELKSGFSAFKRTKEICKATSDEELKKRLYSYLKYRRMVPWIMIAGFLLCGLLGFTNAALNGPFENE